MTNETQDTSGLNRKPDKNNGLSDAHSVETEIEADLHPPSFPRKCPPLSDPPLKRSPLPPPPKYPPPPPPPPHRNGFPGLNSLLAETLGELLPTFQDIRTIETVVRELDEDAFPIFERVSEEGITDPAEFVRRFLEIEADEAMNVRDLMVSDVRRHLAIALYPIPPYVADLLRPILARERSFSTTEHLPVHIQRDRIQLLDFDKYRELQSATFQVDSLILDGQRFRNVLTVRSNAASILELFLYRSLKRIYLHRTPHLPKGERFTTLDISIHEVELYTI